MFGGDKYEIMIPVNGPKFDSDDGKENPLSASKPD